MREPSARRRLLTGLPVLGYQGRGRRSERPLTG
ncbi:hypothetical protein ABH935_008636 [Catenulispora sp. GAS73]